MQAKGFSIEGDRESEYNGVYTLDSMHKGSPVLKNTKGMYCYRYEPMSRWQLRFGHTPDSAGNVGNTQKAPGGLLPVGAHPWNCADGQGGWVTLALTVTMLVRAPDCKKAAPPRLRSNLVHTRVLCRRRMRTLPRSRSESRRPQKPSTRRSRRQTRRTRQGLSHRSNRYEYDYP